MRTLLIGVLLSAGMYARAQYTHFNNININETGNGFEFAYHLNIYNDTIESIMFVSNNAQFGAKIRSADLQGNILENSFFPSQYYSIGGRQLGNSVVELGDTSYVMLFTQVDNCQTPRPTIQRINKLGGLIWELTFEDWMTPCESPIYFNPTSIFKNDVNQITLVCLVRPDQMNNLAQLRFTTFNTEGIQIADFTTSAPEWPYFQDTSISRLNDHLILSGNGIVCGTYDIQVVKTDLEGNVIQSNCYGNQAWQQGEPRSSGVLDSDGNQVVMYSRCENYHWVSEIESKLHVLKVNTEDLSVIYDNHIAFDILDNGLISTGAIFTSVKEVPSGGYIGTFYYYEPTFQYVQAGIMKVTYEGELDWVKLYHPPNDFEFNVLYDIIPTPDGGFASVGVSSDNTAQKHWLLKIDACGYEQPSGCPAVVGVNEDQSELQLQLWPNPFYNLLKAVLPQNASRVFITDMTGRIVHEEKVYYPNQQFDVSQLATGVYLFNVECDDGRVLGEGVVKR